MTKAHLAALTESCTANAEGRRCCSAPFRARYATPPADRAPAARTDQEYCLRTQSIPNSKPEAVRGIPDIHTDDFRAMHSLSVICEPNPE
jgi:hypothetical protein